MDRAADPQAIISSMAIGILAEPQCATCGDVTALVETVAPGQLPARWKRWSRKHRQAFEQHRDPAQWYLLFKGIASGSDRIGDPIDADRARVIGEAFQRPYRYERVQLAGLHDDAGFCEQCAAAYCRRHWHLSDTGYGHCPQEHGKSLDPRRPAD
jgi:hypothetical protein